MDTQSDKLSHTAPERRPLPNTILTETIFIAGSYILDLSKDNNPNFYILAEEIAKSIGEKQNLQTIVNAINNRSPEKHGSRKAITKARQQGSGAPIPIDLFFQEEDPAAQCLERTLLTQAILSQKGKSSMLVGYNSQPPHVVLKITEKEQEYTIDSNLLDKDNSIVTALIPSSLYERTYYPNTTKISNITPNVFSPSRSL